MGRLGYSAEQVRAAEAALIADGVPLMARAASALAAEIRSLLPADRGTVLLLVGSGDNGGDALFAGAELADDGAAVLIVATGDRMHGAGLAAAIGAGCRRVGVDDPHLPALIDRCDVIVDGILGTGASANPALRGRARQLVRLILDRNPAAHVVAVDIPSGIHPTDGSVPDPTVLRADVTVTFGGIKAGLLRHPGSDLAGRVVLAGIGIDEELAKVEPVVIAD